MILPGLGQQLLYGPRRTKGMYNAAGLAGLPLGSSMANPSVEAPSKVGESHDLMGRGMKPTTVLAAVIGISLLVTTLGCATTPAAQVAPTLNIEATVEARLAQELAARSTTMPQPTTTAKPAMPQQINTPNPTFQVVDRIANTPEPPRAIPKEAMPNWATEDDCEVHFDLLLVCAHIVKASYSQQCPGDFCYAEVEVTLSNLSNEPLKYPQVKVDVYNLSNIKVQDGIIHADGLPPKITYQATTAPMHQNFPLNYKVVIAEVCHYVSLFEDGCVYGHNYMNP